MEFDIGTILYIVITLVAVLVGVLGKKKKPAGTGSGGDEGASQPGFLENLERVLSGQQERTPITELQDYEEDLPAEEGLDAEVDPAPVWEPVKDPGTSEIYDLKREAMREREPDIILTEGDILDEPLQVIELDEESGTGFLELVQKFDARTAVIYSAILNRREY